MATLETSPEANCDRPTDRMTKPLIGARATALPKNKCHDTSLWEIWNNAVKTFQAEHFVFQLLPPGQLSSYSQTRVKSKVFSLGKMSGNDIWEPILLRAKFMSVDEFWKQICAPLDQSEAWNILMDQSEVPGGLVAV